MYLLYITTLAKHCGLVECFIYSAFLFQDIFRKYPNKYESIIATLCENLDTLDEPEAR